MRYPKTWCFLVRRVKMTCGDVGVAAFGSMSIGPLVFVALLALFSKTRRWAWRLAVVWVAYVFVKVAVAGFLAGRAGAC